MSTNYSLTTGTTDNGIRVVINHDAWSPAVSVNLWYEVGSAHEVEGLTGLAHLFEHLMFSGSANASPGEHLQLVQSLGGDANATTSFDRTDYYETVPVGGLEMALWLEADRLTSLAECLTQAKLDTEREVVKEEKRLRYDNVPYGDAFQHLLALCFPSSHPYGHAPIGSMEDLEAASLRAIQEFFHTHYSTDNLIVSLSGDIAPSQGIDLVSQYFSAARTRHRPLLTVEELPTMTDNPRLSISARVPQDAVYCVWRVPPATCATDRALAMGLSIMSEGLSSRLHQRLVVAGLADVVDAFDLGLTHGNSLVGLMATSSESTMIQRVEEEMVSVLEEFRSKGPTEAELARGKITEERQWLQELSSVESRAEAIAEAWSIRGNAHCVNSHLDEIRSLTCEDVTHAMADLDSEHRAVLTYTRQS